MQRISLQWVLLWRIWTQISNTETPRHISKIESWKKILKMLKKYSFLKNWFKKTWFQWTKFQPLPITILTPRDRTRCPLIPWQIKARSIPRWELFLSTGFWRFKPNWSWVKELFFWQSISWTDTFSTMRFSDPSSSC